MSNLSALSSTGSYLAALLRINWRNAHGSIKSTFVMSSMMFIQDAMFFALWFIFFASVSDISGWQLREVAILFGSVATTFGVSLFFCDGARSIAQHIQDGTLDGFLVRPRAALPALILSRSSRASLGDVFFGPALWIVVAHVSVAEFAALIGLVLLCSVIFVAMLVIIFSVPFWLRNSTRFSEQLYEMMLIFSTIPQNGQPFGVQLVMYSVLPAGFLGLLPVELIRSFSIQDLAALLVAAPVYALIAVGVFNAGVRRYRS